MCTFLSFMADIQHLMVENKLKLKQDKTEIIFVVASPHNLKKAM